MSDLSKCDDAAKLLGIFKANPCLDTIDLRVGWAMQSPFRSMGVEAITEVAKSVDAPKSSSIDMRTTDAKLDAIGVLIDKYDVMERFSDLPDGTEFYLAMTWAYGSRLIITKIAEDKQLCNAVYNSNGSKVQIEDYQQVIRVTK